MSYLGTLLQLQEGSRLTGIHLLPLAHETLSRSGTIYMHVVMLPEGDNATVASGAVATFLPATLATTNGNQPDGGTWFATFQLAVDDRNTVLLQHVADAAIRRALDLTGINDEEVSGQPLRADDLRAAYDEVGDVTGWAVSDLLIGLLIELTNTDLAVVVADDQFPAGPAGDASELRRARLHQLLNSWAASYEGPAA